MRYITRKCATQNRWYVWDTIGHDYVSITRGQRDRRYLNRWQAHTLALVCNSLENVR